MRIDKLELTNFRGFEHLAIQFPTKEENGGLAVFIGENGSGKTSVLKAISYFFKFLIYNLYSTEEITSDELVGNTLLKRKKLDTDILKGKEFFHNKMKFHLLETTFLTEMQIEQFPGQSIIELNPPINRLIGERNYSKLDRELQKKYTSWDVKKLKTLREKMRAVPRVAVYYDADRFVADEPSLKAKDITKIKPIDAFSNSFTPNVSFNDFFEWFRNTEDYESENIRFNNDYKFRLKSLEAIRKVLAIFLPKLSFPRVKRQPTEQLVLQDNGNLLSIANLSHGERLTFALVGDIIRRLSIANPDLENPCLGEGIVMIDEIEQHLHPSWQRTVIPNLRKTFPNIQFIITTHSPQVLSNVKKENVFLLEDFKLVKNTPHTFGKDTNSILYNLFGIKPRPEHAKEDFSKLYDLIEDAENEKEIKKMLTELEEKYGKEDPDLMEARLNYEFMIR